MALLTNEETIKDLNNRLKEYVQFGILFNYMLDIEKIDILDVEKMLFSTDTDKASISYCKILKSMDTNYEEIAFNIYSHEYPNKTNLTEEEYLDYLNKNCLNSIINRIAKLNNSSIDKTYFNTYNYLLNTQNVSYARK